MKKRRKEELYERISPITGTYLYLYRNCCRKKHAATSFYYNSVGGEEGGRSVLLIFPTIVKNILTSLPDGIGKRKEKGEETSFNTTQPEKKKGGKKRGIYYQGQVLENTVMHPINATAQGFQEKGGGVRFPYQGRHENCTPRGGVKRRALIFSISMKKGKRKSEKRLGPSLHSAEEKRGGKGEREKIAGKPRTDKRPEAD